MATPSDTADSLQNASEEAAELRFDGLEECGAPYIDGEGFLVLEGIAAAPGDLVYRRADGVHEVEYVSGEVLARSADQVARLPVTLEHPSPIPAVDPNNYSQVVKGDTVASEQMLDGRTKVRVVVRDAATIAAVRAKDGPRALSLMYYANRKPLRSEPGKPRFEQTSRRYNHLAIVKKGRAAGAYLRADSADAELVEPWGDSAPRTQEPTMKKIKFPKGGPEVEMEPVAAALVEAVILRADSAETEVERLKGENAMLSRQLEQVRADSATVDTSKLNEALDVIAFAQANHVEVRGADKALLPVEAIKRAVVAKSLRADSAADPMIKDASGVALDAMFGLARRTLEASPSRHPAYDTLNAAAGAASSRRADSATLTLPGAGGNAGGLDALRELERKIAASQTSAPGAARTN